MKYLLLGKLAIAIIGIFLIKNANATGQQPDNLIVKKDTFFSFFHSIGDISRI